MSKSNKIGRSAMIAGMDEKTARKYIRAQKVPSQMAKPHDWPTRVDPFKEDWPEILKMLTQCPELEAKTIFEDLIDRYPGRHQPGQLRTLQRKVSRWRAEVGPEQAVMFAQAHIAGEAAQTDFTHATELGVTILGEPYPHLLCVFVLPYSNWQWATVCSSESLLAIRQGVQAALFQLGRVPTYHQTDNSTAATHRIPLEKRAQEGGKRRTFNEDYLAIMRHFGMKPRTTKVGEKQQNGDVESSNGALKRRLEQKLLLRQSRDFISIEEWERFIHELLRKTNATRGRRVEEDLDAMRELRVERLIEFVEEEVIVSQYSTIRIKHATYSVPSRLRGHRVRARIFDRRIEIYFANKLQLSCERQIGSKKHCINYRHVIWSLVQKPGAFARYVYREEMFPTPLFRRAYDTIHAPHQGIQGDLEYLRILHLAASTSENDVEVALELLFEARQTIAVDAIKAVISRTPTASIPVLEKPVVDLKPYDSLLTAVGE